LAAAKKSYGDLRWQGKATCAPDITYAQAARREAEDKLVRDIDKNTPHWRPNQPREWVLVIFIWVLLSEPPWFVISILALLNITSRQRELCPRWYAFDRSGGLTWHPLTEGELLSCEAVDGSKARDRRGEQRRERVVFLKDPEEVLPLVIAAKRGSKIARDRLILAYRPAMARIAGQYATFYIPVEELIAVAIVGTPSGNGKITNGLLYAIEAFDPSNGGTFSNFVLAPIFWAISKYAIRQRQHEHLSLNATIGVEDEEGLTWQDQATEDVFGTGSGDDEETHSALDAAIVKADLGIRDRAVLEEHLAGKSPEELAAEFRVTPQRIARIIEQVTAKVRRAGAAS
jgi:RNA polymerase sigma factor (sigma-70 family)